jgi:hypothetical protein
MKLEPLRGLLSRSFSRSGQSDSRHGPPLQTPAQAVTTLVRFGVIQGLARPMPEDCFRWPLSGQALSR